MKVPINYCRRIENPGIIKTVGEPVAYASTIWLDMCIAFVKIVW